MAINVVVQGALGKVGQEVLSMVSGIQPSTS